MTAYFSQARKKFPAAVLIELVRLNTRDIPNFADAASRTSSDIAKRIVEKIKGEQCKKV